MTKTGRNAPCHCGSGTKYKKCCLPVEEAAAAEARKPRPRNPNARPGRLLPFLLSAGITAEYEYQRR